MLLRFPFFQNRGTLYSPAPAASRFASRTKRGNKRSVVSASRRIFFPKRQPGPSSHRQAAQSPPSNLNNKAPPAARETCDYARIFGEIMRKRVAPVSMPASPPTLPRAVLSLGRARTRTCGRCITERFLLTGHRQEQKSVFPQKKKKRKRSSHPPSIPRPDLRMSLKHPRPVFSQHGPRLAGRFCSLAGKWLFGRGCRRSSDLFTSPSEPSCG